MEVVTDEFGNVTDSWCIAEQCEAPIGECEEGTQPWVLGQDRKFCDCVQPGNPPEDEPDSTDNAFCHGEIIIKDPESVPPPTAPNPRFTCNFKENCQSYVGAYCATAPVSEDPLRKCCKCQY